MPATSKEALKRKAVRREERRKERCAVDPDYKARQAARRDQRAKQRRKEKRNARAFVGCDGEGVRRADDTADYALFRMGTRELGPKGKACHRLQTAEILEFICSYPDATHILVGFGFEYDISNILRDVPWAREHADIPSRLERLLMIDTAAKEGIADANTQHDWTWLNFDGWRQFGVKYIPRNYLSVCRAETKTMPNGRKISRAIPGSTRTIYDTFGFFQCSFLKALDTWDMGSAKLREQIRAGKEGRESFTRITKSIRRYCKIECELLAGMMEKFREVCNEMELAPRTWAGAGKIAAFLHRDNGTVKKQWLDKHIPPGMLKMAHAAYYGGRFEITRAGFLNTTVWDHDINSAYPDAMRKLPCLEHGKWIKQSAGEISRLAASDGRAGNDALFVCGASFSHPRSQFLCGVPFRDKSGKLMWPREGNGIYWSVELKSAERLGASISYRAGYVYQKQCECQIFDWIDPLYRKRKQVAQHNEARGIPIKLGINALYGKLAQRVGMPVWQNPIWAGLITAMTRSHINAAIASTDPRNVVMIATDGLCSINEPCKVETGAALGQWKIEKFPSLFIVKPGLYWPPEPANHARKLKTRGISPKFFEPRIGEFEARWDAYMDSRDDKQIAFEIRHALGAAPTPRLRTATPGTADADIAFPVVPLKVDTFVGLRLAFRQNNPQIACQWIKRNTNISFDWTDKRSEGTPSNDGGAMVLQPKAGSLAAHSLIYTSAAKQMWIDQMADPIAEWFEAMPDFVDLSIPFK
jgi:hypothetical protein